MNKITLKSFKGPNYAFLFRNKSLAFKRRKSKSVKPLRIARCSLTSNKSTSKYPDTELMLT